mmetsp:Transcript_17465/g.30782  ORF Transcript_17465/g.30782 Transcript_17465/m.30782 type:complete len:217 (+) Transcript_17465:202-852(+)
MEISSQRCQGMENRVARYKKNLCRSIAPKEPLLILHTFRNNFIRRRRRLARQRTGDPCHNRWHLRKKNNQNKQLMDEGKDIFHLEASQKLTPANSVIPGSSTKILLMGREQAAKLSSSQEGQDWTAAQQPNYYHDDVSSYFGIMPQQEDEFKSSRDDDKDDGSWVEVLLPSILCPASTTSPPATIDDDFNGREEHLLKEEWVLWTNEEYDGGDQPI